MQLLFYAILIIRVPHPFGFWGRVWNCIVSVPDYCLIIYFEILSLYQFIECALELRYMDRVKQIWYLSPMRAAKVQTSLRIRAVSPEPSLLAHKSSESKGTFRQKARSLAPLNDWPCAVKICHDGMLEDTNSLGGAHMIKGIG